jgi:hypothetical protein
MNLADDAISLTVSLLHQRDFGLRTEALLREIIEQKKIAQLLVKLVDHEKEESENSETAASKTMAILRSLMRVDKLAACLLMSQLYIIASKFYMHQICDSIDIWIFENHTPELKRQLELNMPSGLKESMKKHYSEWILG